MHIYIFNIANLAGYSVAVIIAESEKQAWELLHNSQRLEDYSGYIWRLIETKPVTPSVVFKDYE